MEAITALGVAGNVLQFIQFISALISTGSEVYSSASGASETTVELEMIYARLRTFSSSLQGQGTTQANRLSELRSVPIPSHSTEYLAHIDALNDLTKDCKGLCDQLLETIRKLKVEGGRWRRCRSFMAALKAAWDSKKIGDMEARLDRFQKVISFHFFPILSDQQSGLMNMVNFLRNESYSLNLDQNSKLDAISTTLSNLTLTIKKLEDKVSENQPGLIGPSRAETLSAENEGKFRQNLSSFLILESVDTLSRGFSQLALTKKELGDVAKEQAVLRSLNFPSRPARHDNIPLAHEKTFRWIIDPPEELEDETEKRFTHWLKSGNGIFWLSGKAGSGKSTLMKFLADHEITRTILEEWANPLKLIIATHYFWSAGTSMQKSHIGLYQTLLYEIFRMCPALISQVCPGRWAQTNPLRIEKDTDWTTSELLRTLHDLSRHSNLPVRYCFFIDGIDEFEGDHFKLCEILRDLAQSGSIKLCLASRPWNIFFDAFGNDPVRKICIENLTRNDILRYSESRLMEHPRWNLSYFQAKDKQSIIDDITGKAQGVFLWVFLVTQSLRNGLTNGDTLLDLRCRLQSLPTDLEPFFKHMLEVVDRVYHEKMASFLSIAVNANQPLHFLIYSMHEHEYEDQDYAVKMLISPLSEGEIEALQDQCRRRVNARCGGLLDVKDGSVEFLHRTVRDFLFTREMSDYLGTKTRPGFSANLSTLRAYVAKLKRSLPLEGTTFRDSKGRRLLEESLQYANEALEDSEDSATELLDNLEDLFQEPLEFDDSLSGFKLLSDFEADNPDRCTNFCDTSLGFQFREELLRAGVHKYVFRKLHESRYYFDNLGDPPLSVVVRQPKWTRRHMRIIRDLLESGQDPNSVWRGFILRTCRNHCDNDFHDAIEMGLFSVFLRCGACRDAHVCDFVQALFSQNLKYPEKSLRVLEDFFDLSLGTQLRPAVLHTLQNELQKIDPKTTKLDKLRFFAKITEKVIKTGVSLGWEMSFLMPSIEGVFSTALGSTMANLVKTRGGSRKPGIASHKRKAENDTLEFMTKRTKFLSWQPNSQTGWTG